MGQAQFLKPTTLFLKEVSEKLHLGLCEDQASFDLSGRSIQTKKGKAKVVAKSEGIFTGEGFAQVGHDFGVKLTSKLKNGESYSKGKEIYLLEAEVRDLLSFERTFLNLVSFLDGIATQTHQAAEIIKKEAKRKKIAPPRLCPTRKTLPGFRNLSLHAVLCGGGSLHRPSLSGGVMLKENHLRTYSSIKVAIQETKKITPHLQKIEVEVTNEKEGFDAIQAGAEVIMLDNFTPKEIESFVKIARQKKLVLPLLEASGGITLENLKDYVLPSVSILSMGSLTHTVKPVDLSMLFL